MPKPNYQYEKRQRELAKKAKKAEKAARKAAGKPDDGADDGAASGTGLPPAEGDTGAAPDPTPPGAGQA